MRKMEQFIRVIAGSFVLLSLLLGYLIQSLLAPVHGFCGH